MSNPTTTSLRQEATARQAGEWTVSLYTGKKDKTLARLSCGEKLIATAKSQGYLQGIADAHNAALSAEREKSDDWAWAHAELADVKHQLAAEREAKLGWRKIADTAVEALKKALVNVETSNDPLSTASQIKTALAKIGAPGT